jgi:hypothetical protein
MRRVLVLPLACLLLAAPPVALARDGVASDGSLAVSNAWVRQMVIQGNGLIFGHIASGTLTVVSYSPADLRAPQVSGAVSKVVGGGAIRYTGADVRFLLPNGRYLITLEGAGIDVSAVGQGTVTAAGFGTDNDGTLSVNGGKPLPVGFTSGLAVFGGKKEKGEKGADNASSPSKAASH